MTTDRPYRPGFSANQAVAELKDCAGRLYDPELVEAFSRRLLSDEAVALDLEGAVKVEPIQKVDVL